MPSFLGLASLFSPAAVLSWFRVGNDSVLKGGTPMRRNARTEDRTSTCKVEAYVWTQR